MSEVCDPKLLTDQPCTSLSQRAEGSTWPKTFTPRELRVLAIIGIGHASDGFAAYDDPAELAEVVRYQLSEYGKRMVQAAFRAAFEPSPEAGVAAEEMHPIIAEGHTILRGLVDASPIAGQGGGPADRPRLHDSGGYCDGANQGRELWRRPDGGVFYYDAAVTAPDIAAASASGSDGWPESAPAPHPQATGRGWTESFDW